MYVEVYNEEATQVNNVVFSHNQALLHQYEQDDTAVLDDLAKEKWEYQPTIDIANLNLRHHVKLMMKEYGVNRYKNSKMPGAHLPYNSEPMVEYRKHINEAQFKLGVHPRLILYWDQIWVLLMTPEAHIVYKNPKMAGAIKCFSFVDLRKPLKRENIKLRNRKVKNMVL